MSDFHLGLSHSHKNCHRGLNTVIYKKGTYRLYWWEPQQRHHFRNADFLSLGVWQELSPPHLFRISCSSCWYSVILNTSLKLGSFHWPYKENLWLVLGVKTQISSLISSLQYPGLDQKCLELCSLQVTSKRLPYAEQTWCPRVLLMLKWTECPMVAVGSTWFGA